MSGQFTIPLTLDFGQVVILLVSGAFGLILKAYNDRINGVLKHIDVKCEVMNDKIASGDLRVEETARDGRKRLEDKINQLESILISIPAKMDILSEQIRRMELNLATGFIDKDDFETALEKKRMRIERLEASVFGHTTEGSPPSPRRPHRSTLP